MATSRGGKANTQTPTWSRREGVVSSRGGKHSHHQAAAVVHMSTVGVGNFRVLVEASRGPGRHYPSSISPATHATALKKGGSGSCLGLRRKQIGSDFWGWARWFRGHSTPSEARCEEPVLSAMAGTPMAPSSTKQTQRNGPQGE